MAEPGGKDASGGALYDEASTPDHHAVTLETSIPDLPRLVPRKLPFHQSQNRILVHHNLGWEIFKLLKYDLFHVLLRAPIYQSMLGLLTIWTLMLIVFALVYRAVDQRNPQLECGLGAAGSPIEFGASFAFSLETCTTVGYGLPSGTNAFFENCPGLQVVIYFQMVWSMLFNAFLFAFLYSGVSKCDARGNQVVYSSKAVVSYSPESDQVRFQIRIYDADAEHPVVEAHVRLYVVLKDRPVPRPLRILQPDDELGAMLFSSWPTVVSHHIDLYSLLHPHDMTPPLPQAGLVLRQSDSTTASREEVICPVCGESYGTYERWIRHVNFQKIVEEKDNYPLKGTHLELTDQDCEEFKEELKPIQDVNVLRKYFEENVSEVICVFEAIDPLMSGTFQALQSYRIEDIVWHADAGFRPCIHVEKGKQILVDLNLFHEIDITPRSSEQNSSIKSIADNKPMPPPPDAASEPPQSVPSSGNKSGSRKSSKRKKQRSSRPCDAIAGSFFPTVDGATNPSNGSDGRKGNTPHSGLEPIEDSESASM